MPPLATAQPATPAIISRRFKLRIVFMLQFLTQTRQPPLSSTKCEPRVHFESVTYLDPHYTGSHRILVQPQKNGCRTRAVVRKNMMNL